MVKRLFLILSIFMLSFMAVFAGLAETGSGFSTGETETQTTDSTESEVQKESTTKSEVVIRINNLSVVGTKFQIEYSTFNFSEGSEFTDIRLNQKGFSCVEKTEGSVKQSGTLFVYTCGNNFSSKEIFEVSIITDKAVHYSTVYLSSVDSKEPCYDSDGKDYYVKGTTRGEGSAGGTDYCILENNKSKLLEYYCKESSDPSFYYANYYSVETFDCPNGCSNGACNISKDNGLGNYEFVPGKGNKYYEGEKCYYWTLINDNEAKNLENSSVIVRKFSSKTSDFWAAKWDCNFNSKESCDKKGLYYGCNSPIGSDECLSLGAKEYVSKGYVNVSGKCCTNQSWGLECYLGGSLEKKGKCIKYSKGIFGKKCVGWEVVKNVSSDSISNSSEVPVNLKVCTKIKKTWFGKSKCVEYGSTENVSSSNTNSDTPQFDQTYGTGVKCAELSETQCSKAVGVCKPIYNKKRTWFFKSTRVYSGCTSDIK